MQSFGRFSVFPVIPDRLNRLPSLAQNLWWTWHPEAQQLYKDLDPALWDEVGHNPIRFLSRVHSRPLERAAANPDYLARYDAVLAAFDKYMADEHTWFKEMYGEGRRKKEEASKEEGRSKQEEAAQLPPSSFLPSSPPPSSFLLPPSSPPPLIAYFSPEFGLHESLPIYSGGLGVLAGDHIKEASDLGLPLVGIGFLYPQGYFVQHINADGVQEATAEHVQFSEVPTEPAVDNEGREIVVHVDLPGRRVYAKVWKFQVGRVPLYLMDTDVETNELGDRDLGSKLYVADHALRIAQEVVLGIGGVRVLRKLGLHPTVWHMNEGHSAFLGLERIRELVEDEGLAFEEARQAVAASSVFTTHTPVAAGNEAFGFDLMDLYFRDYWPSLGIDRDQFMDLARLNQPWGPTFSMTILALRLSSLANGVSQLHGQVSRNMWDILWPGLAVEEIPITAITNGVHVATWLDPALDALYKEYLGDDWYSRHDDPALWEGVERIPDSRLWEVHTRLKQAMVDCTRRATIAHRAWLGEGPRSLAEAERILDPNALTVGFARRFATYKRATLFMKDLDRLYKLLTGQGRPVQFVFAGKAHPADEPGKQLIRQIYKLSRTTEFAGKIVYIEDYDMETARYLISGVDVWLNNPSRPREASGTSGQKASLNGIPNWSVLDGWWPEGYDGRNGWAIGEGRIYANEEVQYEADALSLYNTLEHAILPAYYTRDKGVPSQWVKVMKQAIQTLAWRFSARRMVKEYTTRLYMPADAHGRRFAEPDRALARDVVQWRERVEQGWPDIRLDVEAQRDGQLAVGATVPITARVHLGSLRPDDVLVEAVTWRLDGQSQPVEIAAAPLQRVSQDGDSAVYEGQIVAEQSGQLAYNVRVLPSHPGLTHKHALNLVTWA